MATTIDTDWEPATPGVASEHHVRLIRERRHKTCVILSRRSTAHHLCDETPLLELTTQACEMCSACGAYVTRYAEHCTA